MKMVIFTFSLWFSVFCTTLVAALKGYNSNSHMSSTITMTRDSGWYAAVPRIYPAGKNYCRPDENPSDCHYFLRGAHIEVGVHPTASFGTTGMNLDSSHGSWSNDVNSKNFLQVRTHRGRMGHTGGFGFIAQVSKTVGAESCPASSPWAINSADNCRIAGDYFVPGCPLEGWSLFWRDGSTTAALNRRWGFGNLNRGVIHIVEFRQSSPDWKPGMAHFTHSLTWVGVTGTSVNCDKNNPTSCNLKITKTIQFNTNDRFFTTQVTLQNLGSTTLYDLYYSRNVDPDQAQPSTGGYTTSNWVEYQGENHPYGDYTTDVNYENPHQTLVMSTGVGNAERYMVLGLGTDHPNARVAHFGFFNEAWNDVQWAWNTKTWNRGKCNPSKKELWKKVVRCV